MYTPRPWGGTLAQLLGTNSKPDNILAKLPDLSDHSEILPDIEMVGITPPTAPRLSAEWVKHRKEMASRLIVFADTINQMNDLDMEEELSPKLVQSWLFLKTIQNREYIENQHLGKSIIEE